MQHLRKGAKIKEIKFLNQDELDRFFSAIRIHGNLRDHAIFHLCYYCGLRASEIAIIKYSDFNTGNSSLFIRRLKGSHCSSVTLDSCRLKALKSHIRNVKYYNDDDSIFLSTHKMPIGRSSIYRLFDKYAKMAKIPKNKRHPHTLKHSMGVHLLDSGADVEDVREHLGHKSLKNTLIYIQYTPHRKRRLNEIVRKSRFICR